MKFSGRTGSPARSSIARVSGFISILLIITMACFAGKPEPPPMTLDPGQIYTAVAQTIVASTTETASAVMPQFPWPPPKPSTRAPLTLGTLRQTAANGVTFHDVDERISAALAVAGYDEKSYFGVPNGFAIVTRLEHIDQDGSPAKSDRWVSSLTPMSLTSFSLTEYLQALFSAPEGHYRIFVFIVTSDIVVPSGTPVTQGEAKTWVVEGADQLPSAMETLPYTEKHKSTVYIYEFVQSGMGANANQNIPSTITGRQHLERAGLWDILEE